VYALIADFLGRRYRLNPQQLDGDRFVFKLSPRAYYFSSSSDKVFSFFTFDVNGQEYSLVLNIDATVRDDRKYSRLNLDVAVLEGVLSSNSVDRFSVVFFAECKSIGNATPEYVATVFGQRYIVKHGHHPHADMMDILAVRGKATSYAMNMCDIVSSRFRVNIDVVDNLRPGGVGIRKLESATSRLIQYLERY